MTVLEISNLILLILIKWRNKPLLRREGDKIFKTGQEAVQLLNNEAMRKDTVR